VAPAATAPFTESFPAPGASTLAGAEAAEGVLAGSPAMA
jgi:hypothetical protein